MATSNVNPGFEHKGFGYRACSSLCWLFHKTSLKRYSLRAKAVGGRFDSREQYKAERVSNIDEYRKNFGEFANFRNKTVMELGCSTGYLIGAFRDLEPFQAIGVDLDSSCVRAARQQYGDHIQFEESTASSIPLNDECVDIIYCVDTVEHLSSPREILMDCFRILRPGGQLLIHWHPWLGPYGSHLEDIIPFPWAHAMFSMDTLLGVASDLYDSHDYVPACYWFDSETNQRRPNPYRDREKWEVFLNKMTIRGFRRLLAELPFKVVQFRRRGFGGKAYKSAKLLSGLAHVPVLDEFFLKAVICVLEKPQGKPH
jgi:SAM-dependent methyltransferase